MSDERSTRNLSQWIDWALNPPTSGRFRVSYVYDNKDIELEAHPNPGGVVVIYAAVAGDNLPMWIVPYESLTRASIQKWLCRRGCMNTKQSECASRDEWVAQTVESSQDFGLRGFSHTFKGLASSLSICGDTHLRGPNNAWISKSRDSVDKEWVVAFAKKAVAEDTEQNKLSI